MMKRIIAVAIAAASLGAAAVVLPGAAHADDPREVVRDDLKQMHAKHTDDATLDEMGRRFCQARAAGADYEAGLMAANTHDGVSQDQWQKLVRDTWSAYCP